jgi:hypothetical protein
VQQRHLSLRPQLIASHMQGERETDGLFDSVKLQVSGNGQGPSVPSLLHRRNAGGTEYDLGIFCYVEHLLAAEPPWPCYRVGNGSRANRKLRLRRTPTTLSRSRVGRSVVLLIAARTPISAKPVSG